MWGGWSAEMTSSLCEVEVVMGGFVVSDWRRAAKLTAEREGTVE